MENGFEMILKSFVFFKVKLAAKRLNIYYKKKTNMKEC